MKKQRESNCKTCPRCRLTLLKKHFDKLQNVEELRDLCRYCEQEIKDAKIVKHKRKGIYKYNISQKRYDEMWHDQAGRCLICGIHESELTKRLCIDHDHKTGKVRGLLCSACNSGIGLFKENPTLLLNAMLYLNPEIGNRQNNSVIFKKSN